LLVLELDLLVSDSFHDLSSSLLEGVTSLLVDLLTLFENFEVEG
jgi:hypothetical protein